MSDFVLMQKVSDGVETPVLVNKDAVRYIREIHATMSEVVFSGGDGFRVVGTIQELQRDFGANAYSTTGPKTLIERNNNAQFS